MMKRKILIAFIAGFMAFFLIAVINRCNQPEPAEIIANPYNEVLK